MKKFDWLWGVAAAAVMAFLAIYPQLDLQRARGAEFAGAFATCDLDEMAYAAYLQAIADGRPRRNDPYTGRDDAPDAPQPESLFSIQFFPAYLVAIPARLLGVSVVTAMPFVSAFSAFFTVLALFWLIVSITGDARLAATGALMVTCGGALISGIGAINTVLYDLHAYPFFPFLRRHIPSVAFPFLFAFLACLWNGLKTEKRTNRIVYSATASVCFAALVFSYFYLWTSAAAVLMCLTALVLILREADWRRDALFLTVTGAICVLCLAPYALLLAHRVETMDKAQLLVLTHQPDLFRRLATVSYFIVTVLTFALWRRFTDTRTRTPLFIGAFALAPLVVFNQQILTGRSLQPFHYEYYSMNYIVALAAVLLILVFWQGGLAKLRRSSAVVFVLLTALTVGWGYFEAQETNKLWTEANLQRDEAMAVNRRLRQIAAETRATGANPLGQTTLNLNSLQADSQPTVAPQAVLWARHQHVFAGIKSHAENRERYFQMIYYSGLNENWLRLNLNGCADIEACMVLFGWDRFNSTLSANARPLTAPEIEAEVRNYAEYRKKFSRADAVNPTLDFLIVRADSDADLPELRKWYDTDAGETHGKYRLYRLKLR